LPARVALPAPAAQAGQVAVSVPRAESLPAQVRRAAGSPVRMAVAARGQAARDLAKGVGFDPLAAVRRAAAGLDRAAANLATGARSERREIGRRAVDRRERALSARGGLLAQASVGSKGLARRRATEGLAARRRATEGLASPVREPRPARQAPAQAQSVQDRLGPVLLGPALRAPPRPRRPADVHRPASARQARLQLLQQAVGSPTPTCPAHANAPRDILNSGRQRMVAGDTGANAPAQPVDPPCGDHLGRRT
jgi:hypothetical protein